MQWVPHEISIGGVFLPPLLFSGILGAMAAWITGSFLDRYRLSRFLFYPPLVFVSMAVIYTVIISIFFIQG